MLTRIALGPMYPKFLQYYFPGAKYVLAYGSAVYPPLESLSPKGANYGPNSSSSRMLDFLVVLDDEKLPGIDATDASLIGSSAEHAWDVIDAVTRTSAQWHAHHRAMHPKHYSRALRKLDPLAIARYQRDSRSPVLYFPFIRLPPSQEQLRPLWCKYGVVSEADLIKDLNEWDSFHCAGRLHKAFLTFSWERDRHAPSEASCKLHTPPATLMEAATRNRHNAIVTALLLLPERFTFATFLYTVLSLSYYGDIRLLFAEDKHKIRKLLHAQCLPLSEVYLPLLLAGASENASILCDAKEALLRSASPSPSTLPETKTNSDLSVRASTSSTLTPHSSMSAIRGTSFFPQILGIPSSLALSTANSTSSQISQDALTALGKATAQIAFQARQRCAESTRGVYSNRMEPLSNETLDLQQALLSPSFMLEQNISDDARQNLFTRLPDRIQNEATAHSASLRVRKLISPVYFLSGRAAIDGPIGKPLPYDPVPVTRALASLTRRTSAITAFRGLRTSGMYRSAWYLTEKMAKYIRS